MQLLKEPIYRVNKNIFLFGRIFYLKNTFLDNSDDKKPFSIQKLLDGGLIEKYILSDEEKNIKQKHCNILYSE